MGRALETCHLVPPALSTIAGQGHLRGLFQPELFQDSLTHFPRELLQFITAGARRINGEPNLKLCTNAPSEIRQFLWGTLVHSNHCWDISGDKLAERSFPPSAGCWATGRVTAEDAISWSVVSQGLTSQQEANGCDGGSEASSACGGDSPTAAMCLGKGR